MIARTRLTLKDYFNRSGIQPQRTVSTSNQSPSGFGQVLANIQRKAGQTLPTRLTISAYLKAPVAAKAPNRLNPIPKAAVKSSPVPAKAGETQCPTGKSAPLRIVQAPNTGPLSEDISPLSQNRLTISESIRTAAAKHHLSAGLIRGIIQAESGFNIRAVSPAGAQGLMQLMPATARELGVTDPFDIDQNIDGGSRYLRKMLDRFGGDLKLALAAYNAGPGTVESYGGRVPPFAETRAYVRKVLKFSRTLPA